MKPVSQARGWPSAFIALAAGAALALLAGRASAHARDLAEYAHGQATSRRTAPASRAALLDGFDLRRADPTSTFELDKGLQEISGLAVGSGGQLFAHADERGVISQVNMASGAIVKSFTLGRPALRADFEGIAIAGKRIFLMTSAGLLYETTEGAAESSVPFTAVETGFGKLCELEGMAYDAAQSVLLIGCKEPRIAAMRSSVTLFRWSIASRAPATPDRITIPLSEIAARTGTRQFHPSSVEVHQSSSRIVVVAGPERAIVELSSEGRVLAGSQLARRSHPQPESVALVGDTLLLIADEGGKARATLTRYRRVR